MANLVNLDAATGRNIIDDDTTPVLTLENTSSGTGLKVDNTSGTGIGLDVDTVGVGVDIDSTGNAVEATSAAYAGIFKSTATESPIVDIVHDTAIASATIAPLRVTASAASGALLEFRGGGAQSTASAGATVAFGVRVKFGDVYGWIPVHTEIA